MPSLFDPKPEAPPPAEPFPSLVGQEPVEAPSPARVVAPAAPKVSEADKVRDIVSWESWARGALSDYFRETLDHWRLYLSSRRDHRKAWEKTWRAHTLQPYPYVIIEGKTAAISDVLNASDPNVQAEGINDEDVDVARKVEKLLDYTFRENQWRLRCEEIVREAAIQGTAALKVVWRHDTSKVRSSDPEAEALFDSEVEAAKEMGIEVPEDPNEYEALRASSDMPLPANPRAQFVEVTTFKAPAFERVSLTDLRFDPLEGDWTKQRRVMQVIVKPIKWVMDRAGDDPSLPFRKKEVEDAINGMPYERFDEYQQGIANMLGVGSATTGYYGRKDLCILWEVFDPEDEEQPWKVVLNMMTIINKDPFPPYGHGECPIHLFRNVPMPGCALGLSELKAPRKLFEELWTLRDLRLDSVNLNAMGVYTKLQELGIPEAAKVLRPGATIALPRMDAIKRLDLGSVHPDVWKEIDSLKADIDDATSVSTQLRGAPASVGRVSASESERRFSSAMLRMKTAAVRFEEELRRPIRQALFLWFQQGDPEILVKIGGQGTDAYSTSISKPELLQALDYDFVFRGPSQATNREMLVQQAMQWFTTFGAIIPPYRQLAFAAKVYEIMGLKGRNQVLPDSDIQNALAAAMAPPPAPVDPMTGLPVEAPPPDPNAAPPAAPQEGGLAPGELMPPDSTVGEMPSDGSYASPGEAILQQPAA